MLECFAIPSWEPALSVLTLSFLCLFRADHQIHRYIVILHVQVIEQLERIAERDQLVMCMRFQVPVVEPAAVSHAMARGVEGQTGHDDERFLVAAMKYTLNLGADTLVPPGNFHHFAFAVDHIDECLAHPFCEEDLAYLKSRLPEIEGHYFF